MIADVNQERIQQDLKAAFERLRHLQVVVKGPFVTPRNQHIYVIEDCILSEGEILELNAASKLTMNDIREFLSRIENGR